MPFFSLISINWRFNWPIQFRVWILLGYFSKKKDNGNPQPPRSSKVGIGFPAWMDRLSHSWRNHIQGDLKEISRNCSFKKENAEYLKSTNNDSRFKNIMSRSFHHHLESVFLTETQNSHHHFPQVPRPWRSRRSKSRFWTFRRSRRSRWRPWWWIPPFSLWGFYHGILPLGFPTRQLLMVKLSTSWPLLLQQSAWVYQTSEVKEAAWRYAAAAKFVKICVNLKWIYNIGYVMHMLE